MLALVVRTLLQLRARRRAFGLRVRRAAVVRVRRRTLVATEMEDGAAVAFRVRALLTMHQVLRLQSLDE